MVTNARKLKVLPQLVVAALAGLAVPAMVYAQSATPAATGNKITAAAAGSEEKLFEFYGELRPQASVIKGSGGLVYNDKSKLVPIKEETRNAFTDSSSLVGARGSKALGDGFKLVYQAENALPINFKPTLDYVTREDQGILTRNSKIGLAHADFGEISYGRWDMYWTNHFPINGIQGLSGYGAYDTVIFGSMGGTGFIGARNPNVFQYFSPNLAGFSGKLQYAMISGDGPAGDLNTSRIKGSADSNYAFAASARYEDGPLFIDASYYQEKGHPVRDRPDKVTLNYLNKFNIPTGNLGSVDYATNDKSEGFKLASAYSFGATQIGIVAERLTIDQADFKFRPVSCDSQIVNSDAQIVKTHFCDTTIDVKGNSFSRDALGLTLTHTLGQHLFSAELAKAGNLAGLPQTDASGAKYASLLYAYNYDKNLSFIASYARIYNDKKALYDFRGENAPGNANLNAGAAGQEVLIGGGAYQNNEVCKETSPNSASCGMFDSINTIFQLGVFYSF